MVGIRGSVKNVQMAGRTIGGCPGKSVVSMALRTGDVNMGSCEREMRSRRVVETGSFPLRRRMTGGASLRKSRCFVIGVRASVVIRLVTAHTIGGGSGKPVVQMTLTAANGYVSTS